MNICNVCMYVCMYVLYACIRVCMHLCVFACMYICTHVCIYVCMYVIFKLGFERNGGNCPSWEGELSGGIVRGIVRQGECPFLFRLQPACPIQSSISLFKLFQPGFYYRSASGSPLPASSTVTVLYLRIQIRIQIYLNQFHVEQY